MATTTRTVLGRPATTPTRTGQLPRQAVPTPVRAPARTPEPLGRRPRRRRAAAVVAAAVVTGAAVGTLLIMSGDGTEPVATGPMGLSQQAWQQYRSGERAAGGDAWQQYRSGERAG